MKKVFVLSFALLATLAAQAQIVSSSSRSVISRPVERTDVIYVKGGLSLNKIVGDGADDFEFDDFDLGKKNGLGYDVAVGFQKSISVLPDLYWGMEAGFGTRGFKYAASGTETYYGETLKYDASVVMLQHAVKLTPLQIGYKLSAVEPLVFDFHIGVYASYDLAGKISSTATAHFDGETEKDSESIKMSEYGDDFRKYDVGINPGVTVWYGNIGVDLTYQKGFIEMVKDEDFYANSLLLRLALRF